MKNEFTGEEEFRELNEMIPDWTHQIEVYKDNEWTMLGFVDLRAEDDDTVIDFEETLRENVEYPIRLVKIKKKRYLIERRDPDDPKWYPDGVGWVNNKDGLDIMMGMLHDLEKEDEVEYRIRYIDTD